MEGNKSESKWREAIKKLQKIHPLVGASIEKNPGERPFFTNKGIQIEPTFGQWTSESSAEKELEKAHSKTYLNYDVLTFFKIYQGENKTVIRGSYSHVPYDGKFMKSNLLFY